jgi:predicted enzyme related to lactoylglutathione lyase
MSTLEQVKADLARLRDEAKVQAHLGGMEARQEWEELEEKWHRFVAEADLQSSAQSIAKAVGNVGQELRSAYQRLARAA